MIKRLRYFDDAVRDRLASAGLADYDALLESGTQTVHSTTRTRTHRLELPPSSADRPRALFVKVYRPGRRGFKFLLRLSKAMSEAMNLRRLARWGVPAVRVVAVGSHRTWWGLASAMLVTAEWSDATTLADHARANWPIRGSGPAHYRDFRVQSEGPISQSAQADQQEIAGLLARVVRAMHGHNFFHRDLQWRNILVRHRAGGPWEVRLIDCPRGFYNWGGIARTYFRVADLASLDRFACIFMTRTERLRWLMQYLNIEKMDAAARRFARRIIAYRDRFERRRHPASARIRRGDRIEPLAPSGATPKS